MKHEHVILQFGKTLGKNGSSRALNSPLDSTMGGRGAFNLFGHIWTRHHLSLWYHPVLMHCTSHSGWLPPGEPESHHRERGCELGEEESKGGQSPEPCCCSQPSAQTRCQGWFCSAGAGRHLQQLWLAWLSWCFIMVSLECVSSPWDPPRAACWAVPPPPGGEQELSLQELLSALPHASTEPQLLQLGIPPGAHPETTLPFLLLPQQSPVPLPASCTSTQVRGRIPEVLGMPQENLWALPGAACWAGLTQCPDQYLDTAACFCLAANIPCVTFSSQLM